MSITKAGTKENLKQSEEDYKQGYDTGQKEMRETTRREQAYNSLAKAEEFLSVIVLDGPHNVFKDSIIKALHHTRQARKSIKEG